ncbi:MAG: hypothetical protein AAFP17_13820 [Pseudomonadota bacterium]
MQDGWERYIPALLFGAAGLVGGVVAVLIGPLLGLDDGPDAWLTPLLSGAVGYGYGWYTSRPRPPEDPRENPHEAPGEDRQATRDEDGDDAR